MIVKSNSKWTLFNKEGTKKLGEFKTKKEAEKREKQVLFFKSQKNKRK